MLAPQVKEANKYNVIMRCASLESVQLHAQSQINYKSNIPKFTKDKILIRLLAI
jgi:hypothetical protein